MRRLLSVAVLVVGVLLLLLGCVALRPPGSSVAVPILAHVPFTPENQARRSACGFPVDGGSPAPGFRVHATYRVGVDALVVYTVDCPPDDGQGLGAGGGPDLVGPLVGARRARRMEGPAGILAYSERGGSMVERLPSRAEPLVLASDAGRGWALVYGRALAPPVATVEVDFDDGSTQRVRAAGVFSVLSRGADVACEVRGLDAAARVVATVGWEQLGGSPFVVPGEPPPVDDCPR